MNTDYPRKVNYSEYELSFSDDKLKSFVEDRLRNLSDFDTETMRGLIYGYTFTEDYAKGIVPDTLSMDYWSRKDPPRFPKPSKKLREIIPLSISEYIGHGGRIRDAIKSTGDGTIDHPYCVICVGQEYEFLRHGGFGPVKIIRQRLLPGWIDCIDIEGMDCSKSICFDISRWFERVKLS